MIGITFVDIFKDRLTTTIKMKIEAITNLQNIIRGGTA